MAIITIPQASRIVLSILVFGGFVFAISRYALRFGGRAIVAMHWPQKQDAVMLHFADGAEMPAVITSTYCASWFVAINAKAGKHNYFIAAALDGADSFRLLRMRVLALALSGDKKTAR